ncbi:hypothetical protein B0H10DRAFT_1962478 [Mycena sp. CBHHK59/15]|nr:hypothetical protein B0H10DRAFT_1962478 [Mycena sp. CBHHK59/15]
MPKLALVPGICLATSLTCQNKSICAGASQFGKSKSEPSLKTKTKVKSESKDVIAKLTVAEHRSSTKRAKMPHIWIIVVQTYIGLGTQVQYLNSASKSVRSRPLEARVYFLGFPEHMPVFVFDGPRLNQPTTSYHVFHSIARREGVSRGVLSQTSRPHISNYWEHSPPVGNRDEGAALGASRAPCPRRWPALVGGAQLGIEGVPERRPELRSAATSLKICYKEADNTSTPGLIPTQIRPPTREYAISGFPPRRHKKFFHGLRERLELTQYTMDRI